MQKTNDVRLVGSVNGAGAQPASEERYCQTRTVNLPFDVAIATARDALGIEGFGVLTEIDVKATLHKKLQVDFPPYTILGACNPAFAHKALQAEHNIGVLLPCNVVVREGEDREHSVVVAIDPEISLSRVDNPELAPLAAQVKQRLERVLERVAQAARE